MWKKLIFSSVNVSAKLFFRTLLGIQVRLCRLKQWLGKFTDWVGEWVMNESMGKEVWDRHRGSGRTMVSFYMRRNPLETLCR